ncbi:MAG: RdgB/HAM1 family non-canonical purine NTP pyrophosphatase [Verrucomicrobiota bacterium]
MNSTLLVATHNAHKTAEIARIVADRFSEVTDLTSIPGLTPPEEDGATFAANSEIKSLAASQAAPQSLVLADDSGLEVDALGGAPGVYSARYAGPNSTDQSNREKLLSELARLDVSVEARTARFRCSLTLAQGGSVMARFDGTCEGRIAEEESGSGGFGYDPIFIPEGHDSSFGVLPAKVKNAMSHRGRAMASFLDWWDRES